MIFIMEHDFIDFRKTSIPTSFRSDISSKLVSIAIDAWYVHFENFLMYMEKS